MSDRADWKPVRGYEGFYVVSRYGEIVSVRTGKALVPYAHTKGYLKVDLRKGDEGSGHGKQLFVHRIVADAFIKNPRGLAQINHIDCDKHNNRADNLEWCSNDYNQGYRTAVNRLRNNGGEKHGSN